MKLELTCTETTQSFHRPRRLHNGSPIKSDDLELSNTTNVHNIVFNPIPMFVVPSLIQFTPKANMHAFDNDHDYLQLTPTQHYLQQVTVTQISDERATQIERDTKGQAVSKL